MAGLHVSDNHEVEILDLGRLRREVASIGLIACEGLVAPGSTIDPGFDPDMSWVRIDDKELPAQTQYVGACPNGVAHAVIEATGTTAPILRDYSHAHSYVVVDFMEGQITARNRVITELRDNPDFEHTYLSILPFISRVGLIK